MNAQDVTAEVYDAAYYGCDPTLPPKANYRRYGPASLPGWSAPLAQWIALHCDGPVLDLGCAYGHLVADLARLGMDAHGLEWSKWAVSHRLHSTVRRGDARQVTEYYGPGSFGTIVSLDFLEHHPPEITTALIYQLEMLVRPGGTMLHLLGCPIPGRTSNHPDDPTHLNHEPLAWYVERFAETGFRVSQDVTAQLNQHPAWAATDWNGRWIALEDARRV